MAAVAAVLLALAAPPVAAQGVEPGRIYKNVVYLTVGDKPLHLDAYIHPDAKKAPTPVLIHFHGGGWARGSRPDSWTGFRRYLAAGFSVVTVEYRLAGEGRAPAAVQDARCALRWVGTNAERLGFDRQRIVVSGTSSGGHLALMAGLLPPKNDIDLEACRNGPRVAAIVDFYGPADLTAARTPAGRRHPTVANWIGTDHRADAMERKMSPIRHLSADSPPIFIGHGDADTVVPIEQSARLKQRLDALGVPSDFFIVPGGGHGRFDSASQSAMMARLFAFLCRQKIPAAGKCGRPASGAVTPVRADETAAAE